MLSQSTCVIARQQLIIAAYNCGCICSDKLLVLALLCTATVLHYSTKYSFFFFFFFGNIG